jgi:hypothetical protein
LAKPQGQLKNKNSLPQKSIAPLFRPGLMVIDILWALAQTV